MSTDNENRAIFHVVSSCGEITADAITGDVITCEEFDGKGGRLSNIAGFDVDEFRRNYADFVPGAHIDILLLTVRTKDGRIEPPLSFFREQAAGALISKERA